MGSLAVPTDTYYGASTQRAVDNFPLSGLRFPRRFIRALGLIKWGAALVNRQLGLLEATVADAIAAAALQVALGELDDHFPVDVFQTGSGTSTNMNANEVIANRAAEILGGERGSKDLVHPNDHVNRGQSSNDVIPTAIHLSSLIALEEVLVPAVQILRQDLEAKKTDLWDVIKTGRTHLQDATPIRMGQVFAGYAGQMAHAERRLAHAQDELSEVALGGTAVGTGLNSHPEFARRVCALVSEKAVVTIRETGNHFQAQATLDAAVEASGSIRTVAVSLLKIANDIRWLASGPRCGLGELDIPAVQPGSSIMPGKVNPVIAESLIQASCQVIANDLAIVQGGQWGFFELNTMMPLVAHNLLGSIELLGAATRNFSERCVRGIRATEAGARMVERSLALAAVLVPTIGYDAAAKIAQEAARTGKSVREVARERTELTKSQLDQTLDPLAMTNPAT
jgi:fumarate hydratase class II